MYNAKLVLKDGTVILGNYFGYEQELISEVVFNTSMTGYQEIISDNSYKAQTVCFTYPLIGNYGINKTDFESKVSQIDAIIVKENCEIGSNHTLHYELDDYLKRNQITGLCDVDTRMLTRHIRTSGSMLGCICSIDADEKAILAKIEAFEIPTNQVSEVSTKVIEHFKLVDAEFTVVVMDFGVKKNIVESLIKRNISVIVVPYNTSAHEIKKYNPDAILLSNGPGNPNDLEKVVNEVKILQELFVIFGICLGHQLISLANGCEVEKLSFGHRGANHPVKNLDTGLIEITSQNHSYATKSVEQSELVITHINLLDNSIEGVRHQKYPVFSVQYHPESCPGPNDSAYLFDQFITLIKENKNA